jgi:16S rRNA (guanine527-N7)-methyltransferase
MSDSETLREQAAALGVDLEPIQAARLMRFEELLLLRAVPLGAVARSDASRIRDRHILDCLRAAPLVTTGSSACDLGSGAGLPGVVLAVAVPGLMVRLVEPRAKRAAFLELAIGEVGLSNAEVVVGRVEDMTVEVDFCFARAFAPPRQAWAAARALLRPAGRLVYFAGAGTPDPELPPDATLEAIVRTPVLESSGPLVIMARQ